MSLIDVRGEVCLRPYQTDAIDRLYSRIAAGLRRVLIVAATGAGKTVIIGRICADAVARRQKVLVIAHRRELINQTYRKLLETGLPETQIGVLMASDARR